MNKYAEFLNKKQTTGINTLPLEPSSGNKYVDFLNSKRGTPSTEITPIPSSGTTALIPVKKTYNNEIPETVWQKMTAFGGKSSAGALAAVNIAPTLIGSQLEKEVQIREELGIDRSNIIQKLPELIKRMTLEGPKAAGQKLYKSFEGDMSEIGTEQGVKDFSKIALTGGDELTNKQNIGATIASVALDILLDPLTYLTFGGSTALKIGGMGLTKAGTRQYAKLVAAGVAKGMTNEVATKTAKEILEGLLKKGLTKTGDLANLTKASSKTSLGKVGVNLLPDAMKPVSKGANLFSKGGIRLAEWLPKVGGESLVTAGQISKVVQPIGKVTGLSKVYKGFSEWQLAKAVKKAVSTTYGTPEFLAKSMKKAKGLREFANAKEIIDLIKPLRKLGKFTNNEATQIFDAIRKPELYKGATEKIQKAADIIAKRFDTIRQGLVKRGVAIGYLDNYVPQLYEDIYGKEIMENLKKFSTELPGGGSKKIKGLVPSDSIFRTNIKDASKSVKETLETTTKTITEGGVTRKKEFFEFPRTIFKTLEEAETAGVKVNKNIFDVLNAYEAGGVRIHAFMDLLGEVKTKGIGLNLVDVAKSGGKIPKGWIKGSGLLKNYAFPKDVASYLGSFEKTFFNNKEAKVFLQYYDKALRWWKTMATVVSPGFHFRNFYSNVFNSWLGGNKNPANYLDAMKALKIGDNVIVSQGGGKMLGKDLIIEAKKRGVLGRGWFGTIGELGGKTIKETLEPVSKTVRKGLNPMGATGYLARGGRKLGTKVEEYSRLAHFIDVFKKTGDYDLAAEETFKYLFDYGDLTTFWRNIMNRTFPFGTWMRKNTALQFEQILKQPGKYKLPVEMKKIIESFSEEGKPNETYLPEWLKKEMAMRTTLKDSQGNSIYMRLDLPYLGIGDITDWRNVLGGISPALKIPAELGFGKELFTGKPIERYPGYTASVPGYIGLLPDWIKRKLGVVRAKNPKTGKIEERMNPYAAYLLRQNPLASKVGKLIPFPEQTEYQASSRPFKAWSIFGGIGITPYDVKYRKKVWKREQKVKRDAYEKRLKELRNWE